MKFLNIIFLEFVIYFVYLFIQIDLIKMYSLEEFSYFFFIINLLYHCLFLFLKVFTSMFNFADMQVAYFDQFPPLNLLSFLTLTLFLFPKSLPSTSTFISVYLLTLRIFKITLCSCTN
jgi:hypothetical protein